MKSLLERIRLQLADAGVEATVRTGAPARVDGEQNGLLVRRLSLPVPFLDLTIAYLTSSLRARGGEVPGPLRDWWDTGTRAPGNSERLKAAAKATAATEEPLGWLPLYHPRFWLARSVRLAGVRLDPGGVPCFAEAWIWDDAARAVEEERRLSGSSR
jgi:hypothetical protein